MTRVIAGTAGGRELRTPAGRGTRPTSDRVREALFSSLEARDALSGARVMDLYAGSGALGLEAASRGAVEVTLVEGRTPEQLRTLISRLTAAVVDSVGPPKENVRVVLREVPATHWAAGDVTIEERRGRQEPQERQEAQL